MDLTFHLTEDLDKEIAYCNAAIRFLSHRTDLQPDLHPEQEVSQYERRREDAIQQRAERLKFIFGS